MIQNERLQQQQNRRQRVLRAGALALVLALMIVGSACAVVAWGWIPVIAAVYAFSVVVLAAVAVSEARLARRGDHEAEDDQ